MSHENWISHSHWKKTEQPLNCIQNLRALKCAQMSCWTLPSINAEEPGAKLAGVQRLSKVWCFITGGKVIFYQSISNDHKPWWTLMFYYHLIQSDLMRKNKSLIFSLVYGLMSFNCKKKYFFINKIYKTSKKQCRWVHSVCKCVVIGAHSWICVCILLWQWSPL